MLAYYPSQELAPETIDGYLLELERLAVTHGLQRLEQAFIELRGRPGQKFLPHPTEVAEEIERQSESTRHERQMKAQATRRQREIEEFWKWAPEWMEMTGNDETELLRRYPSFKGSNPASLDVARGSGGNVVQMPRDRKAAAS